MYSRRNPTKRQDKLSSLTYGTSKLVRRLGSYARRQPPKGLSSVSVGRSVDFEYNGIRVSGTVRYIGSTEFSPGKWCGIELNKSIGKHNGSVKGKSYFICRDSHGLFLPFNKVATKFSSRSKSTPLETQQVSDMRMTTKKSVKGCQQTSADALTGTNDEKSGDSKEKGESQRGIRSYVKYKKDKKRERSAKELLEEIRAKKSSSLEAQDVAISSSQTPNDCSIAPCDESKTIDKDSMAVSGDGTYGDEFLLNNISPEEASISLELDSNSVSQNSMSDTFDKNANEVSSPKDGSNSEILFSADITNSSEPGNDIGSSRIPRRVKSIKGDVRGCNLQKEAFDAEKMDTSVLLSESVQKTCTRNVKITSDCELAQTAVSGRTMSPPNKIPSAIPVRKVSDGHKTPATIQLRRFSENDKTISTIAANLRSSKRFKTKDTDKNVSSTRPKIGFLRKAPSTPVMPRKLPTTPRKQISYTVTKSHFSKAAPSPKVLRKRESKRDISSTEEDLKNADPAVVMGNANVIGPVCYKNSGVDADEGDMYISELGESPSDQQTDVSKIEKDGKPKSKSNGYKTSKSSKGLQKEVGNLQNQLKERTDRINELETTLKNNNNNKQKEIKEFERRQLDLENSLNVKKLHLIDVEGKYTCTLTEIKKSSRAVEALGIVIQYYLTEIGCLVKQLSDASQTEADLRGKNEGLINEKDDLTVQLQDIIEKLDAEKSRCESLQKELECLACSHETEIKALVEKHNLAQAELELSLKNQHEDKISAVQAEHVEENEKLKSDHQAAIDLLNVTHKSNIEELIHEKEKSISEIVAAHEAQLKAKEIQHSETVEDLELSHVNKYDELTAKLNVTVSEKSKLEKRVDEITKDFGDDYKVQMALLPYKHLPAELESLQAVLELKNEELKSQRLKNMELKKKVDEYYELQTRYDSVSQENQSLKESLKKRTRSERQLSVERDNLMEKFEHELRKVNTLCMEKEQLMWRASNPDLRLSLPNVFEETEDEGCSMSPARSSGSFSASPPISISLAKQKRRSMNIPLSKSDYTLR